MTGFMSLLILEPDHFLDLLFEAVSAACTVGLTRCYWRIAASEFNHSNADDVCGSSRAFNSCLFNCNTEKSRLKHPPSEIQIG